MTESVIVPDQELLHPESISKNSVDEFFRAICGQLVSERKNREVIDAGFGEHLALFLTRCEKQGSGAGVHDLEGMRVEAHDQRREPDLRSAIDETLDALEMTAMHTIERSNGKYGSTHGGRKTCVEIYLNHQPPREELSTEGDLS
jgi:hypothetical protein